MALHVWFNSMKVNIKYHNWMPKFYCQLHFGMSFPYAFIVKILWPDQSSSFWNISKCQRHSVKSILSPTEKTSQVWTFPHCNRKLWGIAKVYQFTSNNTWAFWGRIFWRKSFSSCLNFLSISAKCCGQILWSKHEEKTQSNRRKMKSIFTCLVKVGLPHKLQKRTRM